MTTEKVKRKLTAILSADVKGYSRLIGADEVGTIRILQAYRGVMSDLIQKKGGRVVDSPGDNVLAEFASVVDALESAVEIQRELKVRNADRSESRRMEFRIGINLGDVVEEAQRIYGDGVNIAARIEGLAEGGGICVSGTAFDHIGKRLPLGYEYMGEQEVKNIEKPVRVYRVLMEPEQAGKVIGEKGPKRTQWRWAVAAAVVLVAGALALWNFYLRPQPIEPASKERMAFPLPDKPSIAVLPFKNLSNEKEQEVLADGITESIIGAISRVSGLFVIASNSVFTYKGKAVKVQQVSEELGVRNVLEGTVQRSGDRLRVYAQLIDATTGRHLWSEKYDREMKDLFAVQDDISKEILTALRVSLVEGEQARVWARGTNNLEAYLKFLKAYDIFKSFNKNSMIMTRDVCQEAIALDPKFEKPYSLTGVSHLIDLWFNWGESPRSSMEKSEAALKNAVSLNPLSDYAQATLGHLYLMQERHDEAVMAGEKSLALNPNGDYNMVLLGITFNYVRRYEEAITLFKEAQRCNPYCPAWYIHNGAYSNLGLGRLEEAIAESKRALAREPDHFPAMVALASVYGNSGRVEDGRVVALKILKTDPRFSLESVAKWPYKNRSDAEVVIAGLRKVGIPDKPPLPLPDKPSIAVLPFVNMSEEKSQEFFSDGLTEEIITALSKVPNLFVIARNSTFTYKGKPIKVQQVGQELGVKYVLEGSVRKGEDRVRITVQLVDSGSGLHLWAERYDRELKDILTVQDEITMKTIMALQIRLTESERARLWAKYTNNLEAYLKFLEGVDYTYRGKWRAEARPLFEEAIALDPKFAPAYGRLAYTYLMDVMFGPSASRSESFKKGWELAQKCLAIDDSEAFAHAMIGQFSLMRRQYDEAIAEGKKAVELSPNDSWVALWYGMTLRYVGEYDEAISILQRAIRLDPLNTQWPLFQLGSTYLLMRRHEEAIEAYKKALGLYPEMFNAYAGLAAAYSSSNRMDEARSAASELLKLYPNFSLLDFEKAIPYKNQADTEFMINALKKAGLK